MIASVTLLSGQIFRSFEELIGGFNNEKHSQIIVKTFLLFPVSFHHITVPARKNI